MLGGVPSGTPLLMKYKEGTYMPDVVLKAEHVTKRFGGITALEDAQLELYKGEVHALVGANGAGKSTLIKIIT